MIEPIRWEEGTVVMLDQRHLPSKEIYNRYESVAEVAAAIRSMVIRGAPAIGVAAAMGIALGVSKVDSKERLDSEFSGMCSLLASSRPTARNLFWAIERMQKVYGSLRASSLPEIKRTLQREALRMQQEDIEINRRIGRFGRDLLGPRQNVLTHCNTGSLATAGYGTALGVVRSVVESGRKIHVFADETRPFLQGARLTAWEMLQEGIPCTVITDSMAGHFMKERRIDAVIVGADRVARNGDVANKIGTYSLALLARAHNIPFYCAAPISTIDLDTACGAEIPIEYRDGDEISKICGKSVIPSGVEIENPAFDITPAEYITAIITEEGIARRPCEENLEKLCRKAGN